jgi:hypothetical protein
VVILLALLACGEPGPAPRDTGADDGGTDGGGTTDGGGADGGGTDGGGADGGGTDGGGEGLAGMAYTLADGTRVQGEVIATYDHRLWWDESEQTSWAVFDPEGWALYPDDVSLRFVSSLDVASSVAVDLGEASPWFDVLEREACVIAAMPLSGPAQVIMGNEGYHLEEDGYGDFAWDLVQTDDAGRRFTGSGTQNEHFLVWGEPVTLPLPGVVVEVVRDAPDNRPGAYPEGAVNNMVGVWIGGQVYLYLLHFQQGSIPVTVQVGEVLPAGAFLGRVGNSGVSLEPHLHLTALYYDLAPVGASGEVRTWSVPIQWAGLWQSETVDGPGEWHERLVPATGRWIDDEAL